MRYKKQLVISIGMIFIISMLFSCRNDIKKIKTFIAADTIPDLIVKDVITYRSDSGFIKAKMISKVVQYFGGDNPYTLFPEGVFVIFYDRNMNEESTLSAGYGKSYARRKLLVAQKNVVVRNLLKNEQLNTEELTWDQRKHIIFSDVNVKITTPSETLYGTGLTSDERFDRYEVMNPKGEVEVEEKKSQN